MSLEHTGDVQILIGCPPQDDEIGRFGAESYGMCNDLLEGDMSVSYRLPARVHGGVAVTPIPQLTVELMGGWVNWSVYSDLLIEISGMEENEGLDPDAARLVNKQQLWARDSQDSIWGALDVKGTLAQGWLTLGARALVDRAAVPDHALSPNNYDANSLSLSGMAALNILPLDLDLVLSYGQTFMAQRTVTDSAFGLTLGTDRNEERWYYPHSNGTYTGWVRRAALAIRWHF